MGFQSHYVGSLWDIQCHYVGSLWGSQVIM